MDRSAIGRGKIGFRYVIGSKGEGGGDKLASVLGERSRHSLWMSAYAGMI